MAKKTKLKKLESQLVKLADLNKQTDDLIKEAENMEEKPVETDTIQDLNGLPNRDLFRINEVADYFSVSERTIRLWIEHGHFEIERLRGTIWVPRTSILKFRLKSRVN